MTKYQVKQEWLEAVMASNLNAGTKVFAFGVFQHMYGNKTDAWPGTKALEVTTGQSRSKFPGYRKNLFDAGFLTGEVEKGRVYTYRLNLDMSQSGTSTCPEKVHDMSQKGTTHVPNRDTNTTSNTSRDTSMEDNKVEPDADAPVEQAVSADASPATSNFVQLGKARYQYTLTDSSSNSVRVEDPVYIMDLSGVTGPPQSLVETDLYPLTEDGVRMDGNYWRELKKTRSLTKEEKDLISRQSADYMKRHKAEEPDLEGW